MSLAPQRPNFVLVWIGIILLTFSLISNFLATAETTADSTASGRTEAARSLLLEDHQILPAFFNPGTALAEKATLEQREKQLAPYSLPFETDFEAPLAKDGESSAKMEKVHFPVELLEPAATEDLRSAEQQGVGTKLPVSETTNHSLHQNSSARSNSAQGFAGTASGGGTLQSTYGGSDRNLSEGQQSLRDALETSGPGVRVKAQIVKASKQNTVIVRFLVSHPNAAQNLKNGLEGREISPKVMAMAREYMHAVQDTDQELSEEEDLDSEGSTENQHFDGSRRRELIRKLRQRQGGLEIIAEMTPAQLRELANKLDARSHKLRALVN